jgi:hypothetical protein
MFDLLYANGDSFTSGMEILEDKSLAEENKAHAYPMHITDLMGITQHHNSALPGATNEFIARQTIMDLLRFKQDGMDLSKVFVVIGWSSICRLEVSAKDEIKMLKAQDMWPPAGMTSYELKVFGTNFVNASISKFLLDKDGNKIFDFGDDAQEFCARYLWDDELEYEKWFTNIVMLVEFFKNNNIKYFMHNTVHPWNSLMKIRPNLFEAEYFAKNYYNYDTFALMDWGNTHYPYLRRMEGHFQKPVHVKFAEMVHPYIMKECV